MLLEVSPASSIRLRLTVIGHCSGGGTGSGSSVLFAGALLEEMLAAVRAVASEEDESDGAPGAVDAEFGIPFGSGVDAASEELIAEGSESEAGSVSSRVMITVSPASLEIPPASARTSMSVT